VPDQRNGCATPVCLLVGRRGVPHCRLTSDRGSMVMTFVNGDLQARFMTRVRGLDPQRCLAIRGSRSNSNGLSSASVDDRTPGRTPARHVCRGQRNPPGRRFCRFVVSRDNRAGPSRRQLCRVNAFAGLASLGRIRLDRIWRVMGKLLLNQSLDVQSPSAEIAVGRLLRPRRGPGVCNRVTRRAGSPRGRAR
jgi:hypothetical protein